MTESNRNQDDALILAIDSGTQSVRALLFNLQGNLVARAKVNLEPLSSPEPGWAEQDVAEVWHSLCRACHQLWSEIGDQKQRIAGLAVTSQRGTIVNIDDQGEPLHRQSAGWTNAAQANCRQSAGAGTSCSK